MPTVGVAVTGGGTGVTLGGTGAAAGGTGVAVAVDIGGRLWLLAGTAVGATGVLVAQAASARGIVEIRMRNIMIILDLGNR